MLPNRPLLSTIFNYLQHLLNAFLVYCISVICKKRAANMKPNLIIMRSIKANIHVLNELKASHIFHI